MHIMGCINNKGNQTIKSQKLIQKVKVNKGMFIQEHGDLFYSEYELEDKLGSGAFSVVYKCRERQSGDIRAVKIVNKSSLTKQHVNLSNKLQEIQVLKRLDHPNIIKLFKGYEDEKNFYIVMEFCAGGELFKRITEKYTFTENQIAKIMNQLFCAVVYFHSQNVIHRDLKPENLLIEGDLDEFIIKIGDFGNSVIFDLKTKISGIFGSLFYIAPEVLENKYNEKCDEWSCGIILYILLSGRPPFLGKNENEIIHNIRYGILMTEGTHFSKVSREAKDLVHRLLDRNVENRISASEALTHAWMKRFLKEEAPSDMVLSNVLENLCTFNNKVKLKSAIFTFIVTQCVSQTDLKELTSAFKLLDKNGDGKVSKEELLSMYRQKANFINPENQVEKIMEQVDVDGSGFIDYTEFILASLSKDVLLSKENLSKAFALFDQDNSGQITSVEIAEIFSHGNMQDDQVWQSILKQVDKNGDGLIDLREFRLLLFDRYNSLT